MLRSNEAPPAADGGQKMAVTQLIARMRDGDPAARDALFASTYGELRGLARARLRNGGRNTVLDTTSLVHESFIRFCRVGELRLDDRKAFFGYAAQVMRSVIVDSARERLAQVRGGGLRAFTLITGQVDDGSAGDSVILDVHEALGVLEQADPRLARVVEMRYFGGYSEQEIAETLDLTERTVRRDWNKARIILRAALR